MKRAINALIPMLRDAQEQVRSTATEALAAIGPDALPAITAAMEQDLPSDVLTRLLRAVGAIGPEGALVLPAIAKLASSPDTAVRLEAVRSLGHLGHAAPIAIRALERAIEDGEPEIAAAARRALASVISP